MDRFYGNGVQHIQYQILMLGTHWLMFFGSNNLLVLDFPKEPPLFMMKMNLRNKKTENIESYDSKLFLFLREQFYGFLTQFFGVFAEISNSSVYITGESYAGYYV
jgi:hypothetical protein